MDRELQLLDEVIDNGGEPVSREKVMELEGALRQLPEQLDPDDYTYHHFAYGIYLRELFMPKGAVVVGKIHKTKHLTIIASGTVRITTDQGVKEFTGPWVFVSEAGAKKAILAITDATLMNPHPTDETDIDVIEKQFIAPSFEELECNTKELENKL